MGFWDRVLQTADTLDEHTYYELLGVGDDASLSDIEDRFHALARRLHPDRHVRERRRDRQAALTRLYARLNEAARVLGAPETRRLYDQSLARGQRRLDPEARPASGPRDTRDPKSPSARSLYDQGLAQAEAKNYRAARAKLALARQLEPDSQAIASAMADIAQAEAETAARRKKAKRPQAPSPRSDTPPATSQPVATHPATSQPVATHPATSQPVATHPATSQPVATHPATSQPVATHPATSQPVAAHPVATRPATAHPVATRPVAAHPVATRPATAHPVAAHPATSQPVATHPATSQPVAAPGGEHRGGSGRPGQSAPGPEEAPPAHSVQRRHRRYPLRKTVSITANNWQAVERLVSEDMSKGGTFLATSSPFPVGTLVSLRLAAPDESQIELQGSVVWVSDGSRRRPGMGLRFEEPDGSHRGQLEQLLAKARAASLPGLEELVEILARAGRDGAAVFELGERYTATQLDDAFMPVAMRYDPSRFPADDPRRAIARDLAELLRAGYQSASRKIGG